MRLSSHLHIVSQHGHNTGQKCITWPQPALVGQGTLSVLHHGLQDVTSARDYTVFTPRPVCSALPGGSS